ncbi:MAG: thioredoxin domain-containing protein [Nanoarchaeota archaeon]
MYSEEGGQREFIVDAPWKIKEGENIPILIMIRDTDNNAYSFYNIKIYDNYDPNNPKFVKTLTISDLGLKKDGACFGDDYTTLSQHIWYYNFSLNSNLFKKNSSNSIHINTKTDGSSCGSGSDPDWSKADNGDLSIFIDNRNLPKLNKWYCGDTHYHSIYTDTYFSFWGVPLSGEFGAPIGATIESLNAMGLDWVTITDHSHSFENNGDYKTCNSSRNTFKNDCNSYSKCLIGEEINCDYTSSTSGGNHYLGYQLDNLLLDNFEKCKPTNNNYRCSEVVNQVFSQNGFGYVAHPMTEIDALFADLINVINPWGDYSLQFIGLEIWNEDIKNLKDGLDLDLIPDGEQRMAELEDGLEKWKDILLGRKGLKSRKVFISAGSDAHGDFNTAFGKEYTCVYAPFYSKENIFTGLKKGNSYISNNGALIFLINNTIIGGEINITNGSTVKVDVTYNISSSCFAGIYRGAIGSLSEDFVYGKSLPSDSVGSFMIFDKPTLNSYYRVECLSNDEKSRIYTNPIWIGVNKEKVCISNWTLQQNWSSCMDGARYKDWIDFNLCGNNATKPSPINEACTIPKPTVKILSPLNNSFITSSNIDVIFNVTNWTVGGKGQTHIHFHIDNIPGLNFSDHLMFYNSPNNIVELNTNTGSTPFAIWNRTNTLRLNNVPNGLHRLRTHLATSTHATLTNNPEADKTIEFFVSSSENIYGLVGNNASGIDDDAIFGDKNSPITIIKFGDYQDPFSRKFWTETLHQIKKNYIDTGKAKLVFRDFPLTSIHSSAQIASEAAECVREKGGDAAYYKYHDKLFEEQNKLDSGSKSGPVTKTVQFTATDLKNWAEDLGYYIENCLNNGTFTKEVIQDLIDGDAMGIFGTPTFFINEQIIEGAYPYATFEKVIEEEWNKTVNNKMKIFSPQSKAYNKTPIPFNLTAINKSDNISYIDWNEARPRWSVLCKDCDEYGNTRKLIKILREGQHNLTFRAIRGANVSEKNISFFIDSIDPQIITTKPANRDFTNGSDFYVTYTENNLKETTLFYGEDKITNNDCPSGRSQICNFNINLTKYNGDVITYNFELRDIANNSDRSRNISVNVDTIPPNITKFNLTIIGKYAFFNISINESNFDKVQYKDFKDVSPSWKTLCSSLKNGICYKKLFFRTGQHNVTVQVLDKARNYLEINKEFAV